MSPVSGRGAARRTGLPFQMSESTVPEPAQGPFASGEPLSLHQLRHAKALFRAHPVTLVGVGMTAFPRIFPAHFIDPYHVVALTRTADLSLLRQRADVFCLEEAGGRLAADSRHSAALLAHKLTRRYLNRLPDPKHLLLYQGYPELEALAGKEGWSLLANPGELRLRLRGREFFQQMAVDAGLRRVPGGIHPIGRLHERDYRAWAEDLGPDLAIQLPEIAQGGGRGTFFIRSARAYEALRERLKGDRWRDVPLRSVLIRSLVKGTPASVALCVTRQGILISGLQKQLIDLPYCTPSVENGIFCGHVWDETLWDSGIRGAAVNQARRIGEYVAALGYRGILGIDFVVDEGPKAVYPIEINPRFTGAFPMVSFLHLHNGIIPLDVFHLIEFLQLPCRFDAAALNREYQKPLKGSHLLLFFPRHGRAIRGFGMRAGIYEAGWGDGAVRFVRDGIEYADICGEDQFAVVDGPPLPEIGDGPAQDPFRRLCHLLFPSAVTDAGGELTPHARRVIDWVYEPVASLEKAT
jgi:hypothetical protein